MDGSHASIARCAAHEDAHATGTCARCGNFVCPLCLDAFSAFADHCEACRARAGAQQIAWEREGGGWIRRYATTVRDVLFRPSPTFDRAEPGSLGSSLAFAAVTGLVLGVVQGAVFGAIVGVVLGVEGIPEHDAATTFAVTLAGAACAVPLVDVLQQIVGTLIWGALYHAGVLLVGGRGGFATSLWSMGYVSAIAIAWLPVSFVQFVPTIGPLLAMLAMLALTVWVSIRLTHVGQRFHELSVGRATLAAWFPVLVLFVLGAICLAGVALRTLAQL